MKKHAKSLILGFVFLFCCISFLLVIDADFVSVSGLEYRMLEFGSWAPFVFVMLCVFRSFMLLPCGVLSVAGGILFGPFYGGLLALAGFTANSAIIYFMAGYFGRDWVKRLLKGRFNAIDSFINQNSFISILYLRIVPLLPFDAVSCLGGISKAKKKNYILGTFFGSIPGILLYSYFGVALKSLSLHKIALPAAVIGVLSLVPMVHKLIHYKKHGKESIYEDRDSAI